MDKIDLELILQEKEDPIHAMKEAIHQALVLASKKAQTRTQGNSDGYEYWEFEVVDEQSILDIEKLII